MGEVWKARDTELDRDVAAELAPSGEAGAKSVRPIFPANPR
jgi:hypothetical protein